MISLGLSIDADEPAAAAHEEQDDQPPALEATGASSMEEVD
ncbi:hypothetical protein RTBOTA2_002494 [Rhodotorula toruloides]|nr:hypothetical protein RTBOTA2_002494 [Rhodotorula toruloides]